MRRLIIIFFSAGILGGLASGLAKNNPIVLGLFLAAIVLFGIKNHRGGMEHIEESKTLGWDKKTITKFKKRAREWEETGLFFGFLFGIIFTYFLLALEIWKIW